MRSRTGQTTGSWWLAMGIVGVIVTTGLFVGIFVGTGAYDAQFQNINGVFRISCPVDYNGNIEDSILNIFGARAITSGLGCNGREPAVSMVRVGNPQFISKRGSPNLKKNEIMKPKNNINTRKQLSVIVITSPTVIVPPVLRPVDPSNPEMPEPTKKRGCKKDVKPGKMKKSVIMFPQNGLIQDDHFDYPLVTGSRAEDDIIYATGDVSFDKNEGIFSVLNDQELLLLSYPHQTMISLFQNTSCRLASTESMIRYDNEAQRFVMTTTNSLRNTICIAVASSANSTGSYYMYEFYSPELVIRNWYFSVWGDYYNACWINNATTQMCAIFQRSLMHGSMGSPTVVIMTDLFQTPTTSPPISLYQDKSTRGPIFDNAACGVFLSLNPTAGSTGHIEIGSCESIDFDMDTTTMSMSSIAFGIPAAQYVFGNQMLSNCIPVGMCGACKMSFWDSLRVAYYNYGGVEKFAFSFIMYHINTGVTKIAWFETTTSVLSDSSIAAPYFYNPWYYTGYYVWVPSIAYDCRGTLVMSYNRGKPAVGGIIAEYTYRERSDPIDLLHSPITFDPEETPNLNNWGFSHTVTGSTVPRTFFNIILESDTFMGDVQTLRLQNETAQYLYTANDDCGNYATCTRNVNLGSVLTC
jgi:hypothetical protein